jgi:CsoR family transcriptional regulator, copper-sensing transcriptional repressor
VATIRPEKARAVDNRTDEFCTLPADAATGDILRRLRRIEGQVRGIQRMLEQGRECNDVLTQLMAIRSGLDQVSLQIVDSHIDRCLFADMEIEPVKRAELNRSLRLITRFGSGAMESQIDAGAGSAQRPG